MSVCEESISRSLASLILFQINNLKQNLKNVALGKAFVLQGGMHCIVRLDLFLSNSYQAIALSCLITAIKI